MDHGKHEQAINFYQEFLATKQGWVEDNIAACGKMADCYLALNDQGKYLQCVYRSFDYNRPRPDFCCRLGYHFLEKNQLKQSIFWYKLATELKEPIISWGIVNHACSTWLPHLQLCVCYDKVGSTWLIFGKDVSQSKLLLLQSYKEEQKGNVYLF